MSADLYLCAFPAERELVQEAALILSVHCHTTSLSEELDGARPYHIPLGRGVWLNSFSGDLVMQIDEYRRRYDAVMQRSTGEQHIIRCSYHPDMAARVYRLAPAPRPIDDILIERIMSETTGCRGKFGADRIRDFLEAHEGEYVAAVSE